jgi:hypothetical protein
MLRKAIMTIMLMCLIGATVTAAPAQEHQVYQNHELGLQFSIPEAWQKIKVPSPIVVMFAEPPQEVGQGSANVHLVFGDLPEPVALEKYVEENAKKIQNQPTYEVRGKEFKTINGTKVAVLKLSFIHSNGRHIYTDQMIAIRDNKVYVLTCGMDEERYKLYSKEFTQIIYSFAFDRIGR